MCHLKVKGLDHNMTQHIQPSLEKEEEEEVEEVEEEREYRRAMGMDDEKTLVQK